jgi:hypothetical protein
VGERRDSGFQLAPRGHRLARRPGDRGWTAL